MLVVIRTRHADQLGFTPNSARLDAISPVIAATKASSPIAPRSFSMPRMRRETVLFSASRGPTIAM